MMRLSRVPMWGPPRLVLLTDLQEWVRSDHAQVFYPLGLPRQTHSGE